MDRKPQQMSKLMTIGLGCGGETLTEGSSRVQQTERDFKANGCQAFVISTAGGLKNNFRLLDESRVVFIGEVRREKVRDVFFETRTSTSSSPNSKHQRRRSASETEHTQWQKFSRSKLSTDSHWHEVYLTWDNGGCWGCWQPSFLRLIAWLVTSHGCFFRLFSQLD